MLRDKEHTAKLYTCSTELDEYAQETDEKTYIGEIRVTLLEYQRQLNHTSPVYDEVTHMVISEHKSITESCMLEIEGVSYKVLYAPDSNRKKVCYVRRH